MKKMILLMLLAAFSQIAFGAGPNTLITSPLPALPPDQEVTMVEVTVPPGSAPREGTNPGHRHNAWVYVYMVEGALDMQLEGGEVQRVSAGQVFVEKPDDVHLQSTNPSATEPAKFVAFMIRTQGTPLSVRVQDHDH